jgi:hypothetical protein
MLVNILFCFDTSKNDNYMKYTATTIAQMLSKTSLDNQYDIYIITDSIYKDQIEPAIKRVNKNTN